MDEPIRLMRDRAVDPPAVDASASFEEFMPHDQGTTGRVEPPLGVHETGGTTWQEVSE
jgi:hypothetical protein